MSTGLSKKFILRENLQKLAFYLRILGYDAVVHKSISLANLRRFAKKERRILITKNLRESKNHIALASIYVHSQNPLTQLAQIAPQLELKKELLFLRCAKCNVELRLADKEKLVNKLSDYILENATEIRYCPCCGRYYWVGSHTRDIEQKIVEIFSQLGN